MTVAADKTGMLRQALEQRILNGLSCEWEVALWVLSSELPERPCENPFSASGTCGDVWGNGIP